MEKLSYMAHNEYMERAKGATFITKGWAKMKAKNKENRKKTL